MDVLDQVRIFVDSLPANGLDAKMVEDRFKVTDQFTRQQEYNAAESQFYGRGQPDDQYRMNDIDRQL